MFFKRCTVWCLLWALLLSPFQVLAEAPEATLAEPTAVQETVEETTGLETAAAETSVSETTATEAPSAPLEQTLPSELPLETTAAPSVEETGPSEAVMLLQEAVVELFHAGLPIGQDGRFFYPDLARFQEEQALDIHLQAPGLLGQVLVFSLEKSFALTAAPGFVLEEAQPALFDPQRLPAALQGKIVGASLLETPEGASLLRYELAEGVQSLAVALAIQGRLTSIEEAPYQGASPVQVALEALDASGQPQSLAQLSLAGFEITKKEEARSSPLAQRTGPTEISYDGQPMMGAADSKIYPSYGAYTTSTGHPLKIKHSFQAGSTQKVVEVTIDPALAYLLVPGMVPQADGTWSFDPNTLSTTMAPIIQSASIIPQSFTLNTQTQLVGGTLRMELKDNVQAINIELPLKDEPRWNYGSDRRFADAVQVRISSSDPADTRQGVLEELGWQGDGLNFIFTPNYTQSVLKDKDFEWNVNKEHLGQPAWFSELGFSMRSDKRLLQAPGTGVVIPGDGNASFADHGTTGTVSMDDTDPAMRSYRLDFQNLSLSYHGIPYGMLYKLKVHTDQSMEGLGILYAQTDVSQIEAKDMLGRSFTMKHVNSQRTLQVPVPQVTKELSFQDSLIPVYYVSNLSSQVKDGVRLGVIALKNNYGDGLKMKIDIDIPASLPVAVRAFHGFGIVSDLTVEYDDGSTQSVAGDLAGGVAGPFIDTVKFLGQDPARSLRKISYVSTSNHGAQSHVGDYMGDYYHTHSAGKMGNLYGQVTDRSYSGEFSYPVKISTVPADPSDTVTSVQRVSRAQIVGPPATVNLDVGVSAHEGLTEVSQLQTGQRLTLKSYVKIRNEYYSAANGQPGFTLILDPLDIFDVDITKIRYRYSGEGYGVEYTPSIHTATRADGKTFYIIKGQEKELRNHIISTAPALAEVQYTIDIPVLVRPLGVSRIVNRGEVVMTDNTVLGDVYNMTKWTFAGYKFDDLGYLPHRPKTHEGKNWPLIQAGKQWNTVGSKQVIADASVRRTGDPLFKTYSYTSGQSVVDISNSASGEYKVSIENVTDAAITEFICLIPLPKKNESTGSTAPLATIVGSNGRPTAIQTKDFEWDVHLQSALSYPDTTVTYLGSYTSNTSDPGFTDFASAGGSSGIRMVKIAFNGSIPVGERREYLLPIQVPATAAADVGKVNTFSSLLEVGIGGNVTTQFSSAVSLRLSTGALDLRSFIDKNLNGQYDPASDVLTELHYAIYKGTQIIASGMVPSAQTVGNLPAEVDVVMFNPNAALYRFQEGVNLPNYASQAYDFKRFNHVSTAAVGGSNASVNLPLLPKVPLAFDTKAPAAEVPAIPTRQVFMGYHETLPSPTRAGYSFVGWTETDEAAAVPVSQNYRMPVKAAVSGNFAPVTLYAKWKEDFKITVQKVWEDAFDLPAADQPRTSTIRLRLTGDDQDPKHPNYVAEVFQVERGGTSSHTWRNLPESYVVGTQSLPRGYAVEETVDPNYAYEVTKQDESNYTVTNRYRPTREIRVLKTWVNGPTPRPSIQLQLTQTVGGATSNRGPAVILQDGETSHLFTGLPSIDYATGASVSYAVVEEAAPSHPGALDDYQVSKGFDPADPSIYKIQNSYDPPKTSFTGEKVWVNGPTPVPIVLQLLRDGAVYLEETLNPGKTSHTWTNLPSRSLSGVLYQYTLDEKAAPAHYDKTLDLNNNRVINSYRQPTENKIASIQWVNGPATKPAIQIQLLRDGVQIGSNVSIPNGTSSHDFGKQPLTDLNGVPYTYTLAQVAEPENYEESIDQASLTLTNSYKQPTENKVASIQWVNGPTTKPTIEIQLFRDGVQIGSNVSIPNGTSSHDFGQQPLTDLDGVPYSYTLAQVAEPTNYEESIDQASLTLTNSYVPPRNDVQVTKHWVGGPTKKPVVPIRLYRRLGSGPWETVDTQNLGADATSVSFLNQPETDQAGQHYAYRADEPNVPDGYTMSQEPDQLLEITNTWTPKKITFTGRKVWVDGPSPVVIQLQLKKNGVDEGPPVTLTPPNDSHTWTDLDETLMDGSEITYHVDELHTPTNYHKELTNNETVTNRFKSPTRSYTARKVWDGGDAANRPTISFQLQRNGLDYEAAKVVPASGEVLWTGLDSLDTQGEPYQYSVREVESLSNYTPEYNGNIVTNRYHSPSKQLVIQKLWKDGPSPRPKVQIQVYQNDQPYGARLDFDAGVTERQLEVPERDHDAKLYSYRAEEVESPEHYQSTATASGNTLTVTNQYQAPAYQMEVKTVWEGGAARPDTKAQLTKDGVDEGAEIQMTAPDFTKDLGKKPMTDLAGKAISYGLKAVDVPENYTATTERQVDDATKTVRLILRYRYQSPKRNVIIRKTWLEGPAEKPEIVLQLQQNGVDIRSAVSFGPGTTEHTLTDLDETDPDGIPYDYTVREVTVLPDYQKTETGLEVQNQYAPPKISYTAHLEWEGGTEPRPTVQLQLFRDGTALGPPVDFAHGKLSHSWDNLASKDQQGVDYQYTIGQVATPANYRSEIVQHQNKVRNIFNTMTVKVQVRWDLPLMQAGLYPKVRFMLMRGAVQVGVDTVTPPATAPFVVDRTFDHIQIAEDQGPLAGTAFVYQLQAAPIPGFAIQILGEAATGYIVTLKALPQEDYTPVPSPSLGLRPPQRGPSIKTEVQPPRRPIPQTGEAGNGRGQLLASLLALLALALWTQRRRLS